MSTRDPARRPFFRAATRLLAALVGLCLLLATWLWLATLLADARLPGIFIAGAALPREGPLEPFLRSEAERWASTRVTLRTGYHVWHPSRRELGAGLPVNEAVEQVLAVGRSWNPLATLGDWATAYLGTGHRLGWRPRIQDRAALDAYVHVIRTAVDRPPTPGSYDPDGQPIPGLAGEALDVEATRRALERAIVRADTSLHVDTLVTPPPRSFRRFVSIRNEAAADATVLMMRQETDYRGGNRGRATNIELAARKLDGALLMPGARLSFNEIVGKREVARGFASALELINGEVALGVGGGVCQVAGTLHAAAFFAGLQVEEYRPHSRLNQFAYLRPGLDTMVAWPDHVREVRDTKDMRIRNPYPFPIVIKTALLDGDAGAKVLRVELYGSEKPFRVEWSFEEVERVSASELHRIDPSLPSGEQRVKQEALPGLVIIRRRTIYMPERPVIEQTRVEYPPTPRIVLVGDG